MTTSAVAHRTDTVPAAHLRGFDNEQNVFLYDQAATPTREAALFFPLDHYYPDFEDAQEVPLHEVVEASRAYDAYRQAMGEQADDPTHPVVVAFDSMNRRVRTHYYFNIVRSLLDQLMDGLAADFVFENNAPELLEGEVWADYKAAFFDATGLLAMASQIDMPRMAAAGGFQAFRRQATAEQLQSIDRFAHPERFDEQGTFNDA